MCFLQDFAVSVSIYHLGLAPSGMSRQFAVALKGERLPALVELLQSDTTSPRSLGMAGRALWAYELYFVSSSKNWITQGSQALAWKNARVLLSPPMPLAGSGLFREWLNDLPIPFWLSLGANRVGVFPLSKRSWRTLDALHQSGLPGTRQPLTCLLLATDRCEKLLLRELAV